MKWSLAISEKAFGPDHPNVAKALDGLAVLYLNQARYADALPIVYRTIQQEGVRNAVAFPVLFQRGCQTLISHSEAFDRSYNTLQRASSSAAAIAVFKLAARFAAGTGELAKLVRKDQDLIAGSENLDKSLIAALSKPPGERNASAEDQIRRRIDAIKSERERLEETFNRSFPDYAALSKPQPLSLKDALLADDEALIALDFGKKPVRITTAPSYAWIITSTDAYWVELEISSDVLNDQVKALREALSFHFDKPFDTQLAFKIYQETFGVFADKIASKKRLSIVTNGALTSLPPQLLVTKEPGGKKLKDVDWLVRSYAVTILPPVASLKILRTVTATSLPTEPMIAFADPVFSKVAHRASHQQVAIKRFYSGTQIDVVSLGEHLEQLPETRKEVQTIGKELKADAKDIILGAAATVTAVKQAKLDQYRIRYFATHGLVAGDIAVCEEQG